MGNLSGECDMIGFQHNVRLTYAWPESERCSGEAYHVNTT